MHRTLDPTTIDSLLEVLLEAAGQHPWAVGIADIDGQVELSFRPLVGDEPLTELIGFRAPGHWSAFAVASPCRLVEITVDPDPDPDEAGRVIHIRTCEGRPVTAVASGTDVTTIDTEPEGRLADVCQRVLGQRTAAAPTDTTVLAAGMWLDQVLGALLDRDLDDPPLTWARCRELLTPEPLTAEQVRGFGPAFAERWPWAIIRRIEAAESVLGLPPHAAEWLDDGAFARWVLADLAPLAEIRADVVELLGPHVGGQLDATLDHWRVRTHR